MNDTETKMQSVLEAIQGIDVKDWYYYYQISKNDFENPFNGNIDHLDFIKQYFQRGGKENVLQKFNVNNFLPQRAPHTNTVFFLGNYLYYNMIFKDYIDNSLTLKGYHMFPFIWFLITLFHDFGYKYENEFDKFKHLVDIETLKNELCIKYDLLKYNNIDGLSSVLFKNIRKYFLYRRFNSKYSNKIDHGILAGLFFYDALVRNRIEQYNKNERNDLYFGKELNKVYAQAAGVIATHNIWLPNKNNSAEYHKFNLNELIGIPPIELKESPLLVLLGIVDTIDPVKIFLNEYNDYRNHDICAIIKNHLIFCEHKKIFLKKTPNSKYDFNKIIERANGLKGWIDVNISTSNGLLCIILNT